jgi:signal transduction histidine kinase
MQRAHIDAVRRGLELADADRKVIRQAVARLAPEVEAWVDRFCDRLLRDPDSAHLVRDEGALLRVRRSMTAWWHEVFSLPADEVYARARRDGRRASVWSALPPHLRVVAMGAMERDVLASVARVHAASPNYGRAIASALGKVLDLELALSLGASDDGASDESEVPARVPADVPEAVRALAEIGRATATFAHEIRNPLASLAAAVDLLKDDLDPSERAEVADTARQRLEHMRRLLDDTLRLAKPVSGDPGPLALEEVARSAWREMKDDPSFGGVAVSFVVTRPSPVAMGHADGMRLAVQNLLLNAAEAQSGVGAIRVRISARNGIASLQVEDDGPGIPAGARDRAFEPFWTTKTHGNGLGLPLVRRVAEAAGGRAYLVDATAGACVCMELPRVRPKAGVTRPRASRGAASGSGPGRG